MYATIEELWEAVFSVGPCRGYTWRIETQPVAIVNDRPVLSPERATCINKPSTV
jgi:hypothetical protein